jgi:hypothetical protein
MYAACAPELAPAPRADDGGGSDAPPNVTHVDVDGATKTTVDATDQERWVGLAFGTRAAIWVDAAENRRDWDIAFRRYHVKLNGGASGAGGVSLAAIPGARFAAVTEAPASGWITDTAEALAFEAGEPWYLYDVTTHTLSPRPTVYALRTVDGSYLKLAFESYYDAAGTPGFVSLRWAPIAPPPADDRISVDARGSGWTYVRVGAGVVPAAASSTDWDLAFRGAAIATNSGARGPGLGGARVLEGDFDALALAPTVGYETDDDPDGANPALGDGAPGSGRVFAIRTASGGYAKLTVVAWSDGVFTIRLAPLVRDVATVTLDVDASSTTAYTHLSLRAGRVVAVSDPQSDRRWDLAIQRTSFRTNGGTSGSGQGAAADPMVATRAMIASASMATSWSVDGQIPVAGPPGSGTTSGNPVLADWYDYDPQTHVVTPKQRAVLVRTADGGYVRLEITSYANGRYRLAYDYAGAGRNDF